MKSLITVVPGYNFVVLTILLAVKSVHYVLSKRSGRNLADYLYYDFGNLATAGNTKKVAERKLQNLLSILIVVFTLVQLLLTILQILLS